MAIVRSYGGRAANIHRERVDATCPFFHSACNACDSLACFGCWILTALIGLGLVVWGSIQLVNETLDVAAHSAAIGCGLFLAIVSIILVVRACKLEHKRRRTEQIEYEPKVPVSRVSTIAIA